MNRLIGVVHLAALPGTPGFTGSSEAGLAAATSNGRFDGVTTNAVDPVRTAVFGRAAR